MKAADFSQWISVFESTFQSLTSIQKQSTFGVILQYMGPQERSYASSKLETLLKRDFIRFLPTEISEHILQMLDPVTCLTCCSVSKTWNSKITNSVNTWRNACSMLGWKNDEYSNSGPEWKETFKKAEKFSLQLNGGSCFKATALFTGSHTPTVLHFNGKKLLATGSSKGGVMLFDTDELSIANRTLKTHSVADILFDDRRVYTASFDGTIKCWEWLTNANVLTYKGHTAAVYSISWNKDHDLLLSGSADSTAHLWRLSDAHSISMMRGHTSWVTKVILEHSKVVSLYHKQNDLVAITMDENNIKLWSVEAGSDCLCTLNSTYGKLKPDLKFNGEAIFCSTNECVLQWNFADLSLTRIYHWNRTTQYCLGIGSRLLLSICTWKNTVYIQRLGSACQHVNSSDAKSQPVETDLTIPRINASLITEFPIRSYNDQTSFRINKFISNIAVGATSWLDGFTDIPPRGLVFAAAQRGVNCLYLLNFNE